MPQRQRRRGRRLPPLRLWLGQSATAPDLWMRDDPGHAGADSWGGTFWDSPDLWVRNQDDGGTDAPVARVRAGQLVPCPRAQPFGDGAAQHFVVTFHARGFAGTQFSFPDDFLPCIAASAEFDLAPGANRDRQGTLARVRWCRPPARTPACSPRSSPAAIHRPAAATYGSTTIWRRRTSRSSISSRTNSSYCRSSSGTGG